MAKNYGIGYNLQKLAFYEWAYGRLGELDDGLGPLGEFVVGLRVGGLEGFREEKAPVDLVGWDGTTYEVKTSGRPRLEGGRWPRRTWTIVDEADALDGRAPLADRWVFLSVDFPEEAASRRFFDPFDPKWWTVHVLTGAQVRDTGVRSTVSAGTLRRAGAAPTTLDALGPYSECSPLALRLEFFRWAYGDLSTPFNFGRLAEFQVLRACGRPSLARSSWGEADIVARDGSKLEVKGSYRPKRASTGGVFYDFATPTRRVRTPGGAERRRTADHFVFAWVADADPDDPADARVPLDLDAWCFVLVPADVIGSARTIRSTKLLKLGYPPLTAGQLHDALAGT